MRRQFSCALSLLSLLSLVLGAPLAVAQTLDPQIRLSTNNVRFHTFGTELGLSQATARAIVEDQFGMLWVGTQDGLNRFDGYEFNSFFRSNDGVDTLADNHILALAADHARQGIWIGTQSRGLNFLDQKSERFSTQFAPELAQLCKQIRRIALGPDGNLWLVCNAGLFLFNPSTNQIVSRFANPSLTDVVLSPGGALAIGADGVLEVQQDQLRPWLGGAWPHEAAQVASFDAAGHLWVGLSSNGLLRFDRERRLIEHFQAAPRPSVCERQNACTLHQASLPGNEIRALLKTHNDEIWVSTTTGTALMAGASGEFVSLLHDPADPATLPADRAHALFEDSQNRIWVGTWRAGAAAHDPRTRGVFWLRERHKSNIGQSTTRHSLPASPVRAIWQERDGSVWLGVLEGGGLVHYDFRRGVIKHYLHQPDDPRSLSNNAVQAILRTRQGTLWVATQGGGLNRLDDDDRFTRFDSRKAEPYRLDSDVFVTLFEDRDGSLWAGTEDKGLLWKCAECDRFVLWRNADGSVMPNTINTVHRSRDGVLWLGAQSQGLYALNTESGEMRHFSANERDKNALSHDSVTSIYEAADGALWLGTQGGGINEIHTSGNVFSETVRFTSYSKLNGLNADAIGAILDDAQGNLWVSTTAGISRIDRTSKRFRRLGEIEGFDRSGYYIGASAKDASGKLMFGGLNGLIRFDPFDLDEQRPPRKPVFTGMRLANVRLQLQWQEPKSPLTVGVGFSPPIVFNHHQNMWTVEFSALAFGHARASNYEFRLKGLDEQWLSTPDGLRSATFTNIAPGNYTFEVRSVSDELRSELASLRIKVLPPPWWSLPAQISYLLVGTGVIGWVILGARRRSRERRSNAEKIRSSETRLKHALWGSRDELWDLDLRTGRVFSVNPLPDLRHKNVETFGPMNLDAIILVAHPRDRERLRLALHSHIYEQVEYFEAAFRMRTIDHDWAWVMARGRAVERDEQGVAVRLTGTLRDISDVKAVEDELRSVNEQLEDRVEQRTHDLSVSNSQLSKALDELKSTQRQLVDSEKMASLGNLVAGVAHEINTPLGIGVTAASHLRQETERLSHQLHHNTLSKSDLEQYTQAAVEASDLVLKNLDRASKLVRSFKQVAVDQGSEERRVIVLRSYVDEVLFALKPTLRRTAHVINVEIPNELSLETYPGAISQILFNLVTNSLTHAFPGQMTGEITIQAQLVGIDGAGKAAAGQILRLKYSDNGIGMSAEVTRRIFEPFFTTKRGSGGSGLGMHVVYNLVTQLLGGSIRCESEEQKGTHIEIYLPLSKS